ELIERDKDYQSVYVELANVYIEEEMKEEAYDIIKEGLKIDEFNKELYFMAGKLAHELGEFYYSKSYMREDITLYNEYKIAVIYLFNISKEENKIDKIIDINNQL